MNGEKMQAKILAWLKYVWVGFFDHAAVKEGKRFGLGTTLVSFLLGLAFLFFGLVWGDILPFGVHYDGAENYRSGLCEILTENQDLLLAIKDGRLTAEGSLNTFLSHSGKRNCNVVVDTRSEDAFDEFEAYCVNEAGKEISYEEYLALPDKQRADFEFAIRYTDRELVLTDEKVEGFRTFLEGIEEYEELKSNSQGYTKEQLDGEIYRLYVKNYYPDISKYETSSDVPLLRNYYYHEWIGKGAENYLMLFGDMCVGSFKTDGGINVFYYGFYSGLSNGRVLDGSAASVDSFIKTVFNGGNDLTYYVYFMNLFQVLPYLFFIPFVLGLVAYCTMKLNVKDRAYKYIDYVKIVADFIPISALIAGGFTLICGFVAGRESLFLCALTAYVIVLAIRTSVFLIMEWIANKKNKESGKEEI